MPGASHHSAFIIFRCVCVCGVLCSGDVTVIVAGLQSASTPSSLFTFTNLIEPATLTSVTPLSGPTSGGTTVLIVGGGFSLDAAVTFLERSASDSLTNSSYPCDWQHTPGMSCNDSVIM